MTTMTITTPVASTVVVFNHLLFLLLFFGGCDAAFRSTTKGTGWTTSLPIVYSIDTRLSSVAQSAISSAITSLTTVVPGLTFTTTGTATLAFVLENSRSSCEDETLQIGKSSSGVTNVFITETIFASCGTQGWVLHLMMHAFGFYHEHQRTDRDNFIYVNYQNSHLTSAARSALLDIVTSTDATMIGAYDFESVTHYDYQATAFPGKMTIVAMPPEYYSIKSYGHATSSAYTSLSVLSFGDISALRTMFPSTNPPSLPTGICQYGGRWYNWCLCYAGFAGRNCEENYCNNNCQNGGTCQIMPSTGLPSCLCQTGYSGHYCEITPSTNTTCGTCPWWSVCNTAQSSCTCDPYPYSGSTCAAVISNVIPTTPITAAAATLPSTTLPTSTATEPASSTTPSIVCNGDNVASPRSMSFPGNFIYQRIALTDITFIANYADLGSLSSVLLQNLLTESLSEDYQTASGDTFMSTLLAYIQPSTTGCSVVDFFSKFSVQLTMQQRAAIVQATVLKTTLASDKKSNLTSRIGAVYYISSSNVPVNASPICAVYDADGACQNGASCSPNGNQPVCVCPTSASTGVFCEISPSHLPISNEWPTMQIVLVSFGAVIILLLLALLLTLIAQYSRTKQDAWMHPDRYPSRYVHGSSDLTVRPARLPNYLTRIAEPSSTRQRSPQRVSTVKIISPTTSRRHHYHHHSTSSKMHKPTVYI